MEIDAPSSVPIDLEMQFIPTTRCALQSRMTGVEKLLAV